MLRPRAPIPFEQKLVSTVLSICFYHPHNTECQRIVPVQVLSAVIDLLSLWDLSKLILGNQSVELLGNNIKLLINILGNDPRMRRRLDLFMSQLTPWDRSHCCWRPGEQQCNVLGSTSEKPPPCIPCIPGHPIHTMNSKHRKQSDFYLFSQARIWLTQREYYLSNNLVAWESNDVPYAISSNRYCANAILQAIASKLNLNDQCKQHVAIVEIGGGHGLLSYHIARDLYRLQSSFQNYSFQVICTDFHDASFRRLMNLPWVRYD